MYMKAVIAWFASDVLILASIWWANQVVKPLFPNWWKANICDDAPPYFDQD